MPMRVHIFDVEHGDCNAIEIFLALPFTVESLQPRT
jgi:hypothetical protein